MAARRYLLLTALLFALLSAITVAVNYFVDPYLVLGSKRWQGFNLYKAEINNHISLSKAYHPTQQVWNTLLVGNSRIEMGLDPQHPCFKKSGLKVYNLGLPGAGVRRQLEYALNVIYQQPIQAVFLSVDFVDFLVRSDKATPRQKLDWSAPSGSLRYTFDGSVNPEHTTNSFMDYYRALFSLDALLSSAKTVALQTPYQSDRDDQGFNNPARDMARSVALEGPHALFAQKMAMLERSYSQSWSLHQSDGELSRHFAILRKFLAIASNKGLQVTIFTNPFHQQFWDLLQEHELYDLHQIWLEEVQALILSTNNTKISLWDFSADAPYIHEAVPPSGVKSGPLNWFWEPAHYRKELGDLMLNTMLAEPCKSPAQFGSRLL